MRTVLFLLAVGRLRGDPQFVRTETVQSEQALTNASHPHLVRAVGKGNGRKDWPPGHNLAAQPMPKFRQELQNVQNAQYYGTLTVGGQPQNGIFDTGSFELLVVSSRCDRCTRYSYDHEKSPHYHKKPGDNLKQYMYGSGPALALQGYDTVSWGPYHLRDFPIFEIVDHNIDVLDVSKLDAIVGIGPGPEDRSTPALVEMMGLHRYSVCLLQEDGAPGYMIWEDDDPRDNPSFVELDVTGVVHWGVKMTGASVGGREFACNHGCGAVIDSGTSLIAAPRTALASMANEMHALKPDCSNLASMPSLTFNLAGETITLPPQAYIAQMVGVIPPSLWDVLTFKPETEVVVQCVPLLMDLDNVQTQHGPLWIIGMPFFRYYYTTFTFETRQVHIAKAGPGCEPAPFHSPLDNSVSFFHTNASHKPLVLDPANITLPRSFKF